MKKRGFLRLLLVLFLLLVLPGAALPVQAEESVSINSDYALLMDLDTGQVLYEKNSTEQIYPASLTKMMTEIVAIEALSDRLEDTVTITADMLAGLAEANASVAGYAAGDTPTVLDLLYGCALPSGADCVQALAVTVAGSVDSFVDLLNQKAAELGMHDTHFANGTGLPDSSHYTTCQDLAVLLAYCLQNDTFRQIFCTSSYLASPVASHPNGLQMYSSAFQAVAALADGVPGFQGGKTGYTVAAGRCLASYSILDGMHLILITTHADDGYPARDAQTLYTWVEETYYRCDLSTYAYTQEIALLDGRGSDTLTVSCQPEVQLDLPLGAKIQTEAEVPEQVSAPVSEGDVVGTYRIYQDDTLIYEGDILAAASYSFSPLKRIGRLIWEHRVFFALLLLVIVLFRILAERERRRRRRRRKRHRRHSR